MKQHRVTTLYQDRDELMQEAGLSSLTRVDSLPPTKVVQEVTSCSADDAQRNTRHQCSHTSPACEKQQDLTQPLPPGLL